MRPNTTILIVMILYIVFITRHSILLLTLFSLGHLLGSLSSTHYTLVIMFTGLLGGGGYIKIFTS